MMITSLFLGMLTFYIMACFNGNKIVTMIGCILILICQFVADYTHDKLIERIKKLETSTHKNQEGGAQE